MPKPKARSATWLSSTYAVDDESEEAKDCSGGYQVMFELFGLVNFPDHFHVLHLLHREMHVLECTCQKRPCTVDA